jgi:hypothetical protein
MSHASTGVLHHQGTQPHWRMKQTKCMKHDLQLMQAALWLTAAAFCWMPSCSITRSTARPPAEHTGLPPNLQQHTQQQRANNRH